MTEIFKTLAGSRLYGTHNPASDTDYKAVHLPTKAELLLGRGSPVVSRSTGSPTARNSEDDVDVESFTLQRFLKLASDMQTIPVEMLFADPTGAYEVSGYTRGHVWTEVIQNRDKILNRNTKAFVGYCKGQAVRYSLRGKRLETFIRVRDILKQYSGLGVLVSAVRADLESVDGVKFISKEQPGGRMIDFLDVYGRQVPDTLKCGEAAKVYEKPIVESGDRARNAKDAGGMDCKALYHAVRIADEGIQLFGQGFITFPCQNLDLLLKIRVAELDIDEVLDIFDEKMAVLEGIGDKSPLPEFPDYEWMDQFVMDVHERIVRGEL